MAARLAPEGDPIREAFETLQVRSELRELGQRMDPARMGEDFRRSVLLWMELPQKLDAALTLAARKRGPEPMGMTHATGGCGQGAVRPTKSVFSAALALALALLASALLFQHLASAAALGVVGERLGTLVLVILGGALLGQLSGGKE